MSIELKCSVINVEDSYIPGVKIVNMNCGATNIRMDINKELNPAGKDDTINFGIYKSLPRYEKGIDFVAHGYVIAKRKGGDSTKIYVSLWGYLVVISTTDSTLEKTLNVMDKVYIKLWK